MSNKMLTPRQLELFSMLDRQGDVPIPRLYQNYYQREPEDKGHGTTAKMQKALGWPISSLNSRLHYMGKRVVPGRARNTYRLISIKR